MHKIVPGYKRLYNSSFQVIVIRMQVKPSNNLRRFKMHAIFNISLKIKTLKFNEVKLWMRINENIGWSK
jgi:hypothetical protein